MSNDKKRDEFEAWARKKSMDLEYRNIPGVGQFYECPRTLLALEAWQASREELVIELPQRWSQDEIHGGWFADPEGVNLDYEKTVEAIEAAGVRVMP
uniref:Uncharacterized protein n=1 Tax=Pseudomonas phage Aurca01 TaxID=3138527 RepID=A0AAU6W6A9_9VIRU